MKNKNLFKKAVSLSLLILCLFNLSGCYPLILNGDDEFIDDDVKAVIDIQTEPYYEQENDDVFYYSFNSIEEVSRTEPFTPDEMDVFTVSGDYFYSSFSRPKGVDNPLKDIDYIKMEDKDGNYAEITPTILSILEEAQKIKHRIMKLKIFKADEEYFVFASLGVNWWTPCVLYYYNQEYSKLVVLHTFANEEVTGIKIHDLSIYDWH